MTLWNLSDVNQDTRFLDKQYFLRVYALRIAKSKPETDQAFIDLLNWHLAVWNDAKRAKFDEDMKIVWDAHQEREFFYRSTYWRQHSPGVVPFTIEELEAMQLEGIDWKQYRADSTYLSATSGTSITISNTTPVGEYTVSATCNNTKVIKVVIFSITLLCPSGDPVTDPSDDNEFAFNDSSTGKLTINLSASLTPSSALEHVKNSCTFEVDDITGSTKIWDSANSGGSASMSDGKLIAKVEFIGLPTSNSSFGLKTARVKYAGTELDTNQYEVFYNATSTNHPTCTTCGNCPNWFYYWKQTENITGVTIIYDSTLVANAGAPAIFGQFDPNNQDQIQIGRDHPVDIDEFAKTMKHEGTHRENYIESTASGAIDTDNDWLIDSRETNGDYNLDGILNTEDVNNNGILDLGEDVGLIRKELTLSEFNAGTSPRNVRYGDGDGVITAETGNTTGTSKYHANSNGGAYDDEDAACYAAEVGVTANGPDWSENGKNWR